MVSKTRRDARRMSGKYALLFGRKKVVKGQAQVSGKGPMPFIQLACETLSNRSPSK
jgi:hypothetical protein